MNVLFGTPTAVWTLARAWPASAVVAGERFPAHISRPPAFAEAGSSLHSSSKRPIRGPP
jgi:hypothetical protein